MGVPEIEDLYPLSLLWGRSLDKLEVRYVWHLRYPPNTQIMIHKNEKVIADHKMS